MKAMEISAFGGPEVFAEPEQIKPIIGMSFPLNQIAEAHKKLEQGGEGVRGKIVVYS